MVVITKHLIAALAVGAIVLAFAPAANAVTTTDVMPASGQVTISSVLGSETIDVDGTITVERSDPFLDGGVLVMTTEIVVADLSGQSVTGPITISESPTLASLGEIRALQTGAQYPASSFFDAYLEIEVPASPDPTKTLYNDAPLRLDAAGQLGGWPPAGMKYAATPVPCLPLKPEEPTHACIDDVTIVLGEVSVGGIAEPPIVEREPQTAATFDRGAGVTIGVLVFVATVAVGLARLALRRAR